MPRVLASTVFVTAALALKRSVDEPAAELNFAKTDSEWFGDCDCLRWNEFYNTSGVECGEGMELAFVKGMVGKPEWGEQFCTNFYEMLPSKACYNTIPGQNEKMEQWCWVSNKCKNLNGGREIEKNGEVMGKWKMCKHSDKLIGKKKPNELRDVAKMQGLDLAVLAKMAYRVNPDVKWNQVRGYWGNVEGVQRPSLIAQAVVQSVIQSDIPTIFDSEDGLPPFAIVHGDVLYQVLYSDYAIHSFLTGKKREEMDQGLFSNLMCFKGCEQVGEETFGAEAER